MNSRELLTLANKILDESKHRCALCKNKAVWIDHFYPYSSSENRCDACHVKQINEQGGGEMTNVIEQDEQNVLEGDIETSNVQSKVFANMPALLDYVLIFKLKHFDVRTKMGGIVLTHQKENH